MDEKAICPWCNAVRDVPCEECGHDVRDRGGRLLRPATKAPAVGNDPVDATGWMPPREPRTAT